MDFQDVTVQGVISFRVVDAERVSERVDFALDFATGVTLKQPLEKLSGLLTELAQQFAVAYLAQTELRQTLAEGVEQLREHIQHGLREDPALRAMGLEIVAVRVGAAVPTSSLSCPHPPATRSLTVTGTYNGSAVSDRALEIGS